MNFPQKVDVRLRIEVVEEVRDERHAVPGKEVGYSVEFFDMTARTVAVVTVPRSLLRAPTSADRPSARHLAAAKA